MTQTSLQVEEQIHEPTDELKGGIQGSGKTEVWVTGQKERAEQVTDRKTGNWMNVHTQDRQTDRQTDR